MQQLKVFNNYGYPEILERQVREWLQAEPRVILSIEANNFCLIILWRPAPEHCPALKVNIFYIPGNDLEKAAREFSINNPNAKILFRACNDSFLFWFWINES